MTLTPINAPAAYDRANEQQFRSAVARALGRATNAQAPVPLPIRIAASEDIADGALCNIWSNAGVCELRNADNGDPDKTADVFVLKGVFAGGVAQIYGPGAVNTALSGLTPGAAYWLGAAGGVAATAPSVEHSGDVVQFIGKAMSATDLMFAPGEPKIL